MEHAASVAFYRFVHRNRPNQAEPIQRSGQGFGRCQITRAPVSRKEAPTTQKVYQTYEDKYEDLRRESEQSQTKIVCTFWTTYPDIAGQKIASAHRLDKAPTLEKN